MDEQKKEIEEDIGQYKSIESLANLEGGKILITSLGKDIVSGIEIILSTYKQASHIELLAVIAKLQSDLGIYRVLKRAGRNKKMAQEELQKLLEE